MKMNPENLFSGIPDAVPEEIFETLLQTECFRLERIVSSGQATPAGEWYDQETNEWVILWCGSGRLIFEEGRGSCILAPGDYIHIPAHCRHRVEWTYPNTKTVWLALHYK